MPQVPDYLSLYQRDKEEAETAARLSGLQAQGRTPETEAKAFALSTVTGQPVGVVRANPDYAELAKNLEDWGQMGVSAPAITDWVRKNDATGLVSSDLRALSGIEKAWRAYTDTVWRAPISGVTQAIGGGLSGIAEVQRAANTFRVPETSPLFGAANFLLKEFGTSSRDLQAQAFDAVGGVIEGAGRDLGVPEERRNFATEVGSALGQIVGYAAVGAATGGLGVAVLGAGQGAEMQADKIDEQGGTDEQRAQAVALGASVTAVTERLGWGWLMRAVPKAVKDKLSVRLGDILLSAGGEALQETVENIGHAAVEKLIYNDKAELFDWSQIGQEAGVAGVASAIFRSVLGVRRTRDQKVVEEEGKARLDLLVSLANQTKLKELAPSKFAEMIKSLGESSVSVPAEQVATLFQGAEATVAERINVPLDDYLTALATKGEVSIPLDHYLANLTDQHEAMRPFIRVSRETLSISDQEEEEMARERAGKLAREFVSESDQTVYDDVRQMLKETGKYQDSDIDAYARVIQSGFRALSAQAGMLPSELYAQYRLTIKARLPDALTSPGIQPYLDSLIERLKRGEEIALPDDPSPEQAQLKYALDTLRTEITNRGIDLQKRTPEIRDMLLSDPAMAAVLDQPAQINSVMDLPVVNAGDIVDGRIVREQIPNQGSIDASFEKSTILPGVREIPLSMFDPQYVESIKSGTVDERTKKLADEMRESGEINPLIVAVDADGLYILEGGHRFDALIASGAKSLPALVVIDESDILLQPAFHGSPHRFDRFSTDKIGTGEGNQAFGWGLYFAGKRAVAEWYRETLSNRVASNQGRLNAHANAKRLAALAGDPAAAAEDIRFSLESDPNNPQAELLTETLRFLESGDYTKPLENQGQLYEVEIPDDGAYLLWDRPVPDELLDKINAKMVEDGHTGEIDPQEARDILEDWSRNGAQLYEGIAEQLGSQEAASKFLRSIGIPGIKYPAGALGGGGTGDYNYVIFIDEDVQITKTFYQGEVPPRDDSDETSEDDIVENDVEFKDSQPDVPDSIDDIVGILASMELAKSRKWGTGRELKAELQKRVRDAAEKAGVDLSSPSPQALDYLSRILVKDALVGLEKDSSAVGWYDLKTRRALAIVGLIHPEILTDENARFAFTWALAVTSNGIKVDKNFQIAERVYSQYKAEGRMPTNVQAGQAQIAINKSLGLFNELVDQWGMETLRRFMQTNFTVGEINALNKELSPGGEHVDVTVKGASILGPKIGNGFFSNLYGDFSALTMDRWLIRTWGRFTGTLIKEQPVHVENARNRLQESLDAVKGDNFLVATLSDDFGVSNILEMELDELAAAIQKSSMDKDMRAIMNETPAGQEMRKAGNSLAKYLDGQKEAPAGPNERKFIRAAFNKALTELQTTHGYDKLTMSDLQAVLWFAEKRLYETAKVKDESEVTYDPDEVPDYEQAARMLADALGISVRKVNNAVKRVNEDGQSVRTQSATGQGAVDQGEQGRGRGFTEKEKRDFRAGVAIRRARAARVGAEKQPWSYSRRSRKDGRGVRLLKSLGVTSSAEWVPGRKLKNEYSKNGLPAPAIHELEATPANAAKFRELISAAKARLAFGAAVQVYDDYSPFRLFVTEDGTSGFAIKPDGDIISVFSGKGNGHALMDLAVEAGGTKLDCFDTILPDFYAPHGFRAVSRVKWDDNEAPPEWNKAAFAKFNNGEPDVVMMVYDPEYTGSYEKTDGNRMTYGGAQRAQNKAVRDVASRPLQQEARAQISIEPGKFEIELFQNADLSSFLHESGHMFLEILADLAKTSPEIAADFQKALTWMGVKGDWSTMSLDQKRPHHEQFARGFEAYLFEGKAPSAELTGIFARFRRWLMAIYRQVKNLDVELNDEIRGVFDRMLATQEEIDQMRSTMRAEPIVADGSALGWSPERFQSYVKALQDAQEAEESAILTRALKEVEREKRAWWKEEFARVLKTVEQEMRAMPQWAAWEGIRGGEKLDKGWLLNRYGQGFLNENMRSKRLYEADGLDPDVVASKYGYDSGDALVQALVNLKPFDAVAKAEAQRRMEAEHGNMLTDGRLVAEAAKALHNNKRLGVLAVEMDALAKLAGEPAMTATETRLAAQMIVSRQRIRDLNPYSLLRAERKAANEALKLAGQKKWGQALAAKKRQVLNAHLYDETIKAQDRAEKMRRFIKKFERTTIRERLGKVGLLDQVEALLSQYDLRRVSNAKLDRASAIQQMQLLASNGGLLMPEELMVRLLQDSSRVVNWRELTVEQFAGLDDVLRQLDRQARNDYQMLVNGEKKVLDDIAQEIGDGIEANAPTGGMISRGQANAKESMGSTLRMWLNSWRRPSSIARIMDGQEWGPITRHIIVPLREAVVTKLEPMRRAAAEKIASIYQAHYSDAEMKAMSKRKFIPELRVSLSHFDLIALGQNWGNASNRKAVVDSSVFGDTEATEEQYAAALRNHLEAKDWAFIQDTWDYIDSFWPETRAALQRRKGIVPPKIEPEAFRIETKDGQTITVRGGYFPLKYDTRLEGKLRPGQVETDADEMFRKISAGTSVASTTKYGHAIERVGSGKRPVLLSINTWHSHIDNVVRDLSLSDAVLYIDKILRREPVQTAFKKTGNREALETLNLWLQDVAVGEIPPVGFEQISAMLRTNFTLAKIGFNLNTVILQVTGLPQSMVVVGKRAMWAGLKRYAKGPVSAVREAMDQSAFMSARYELNTFNKDIVQVAEYLNGRSTDTGDGIAGAMIAVARKLRISPRLASWAFAGIRITQMQVDAITWHAAYAKAVEQQVPDPVRYADSVVENAQTSGLFMDRAGLERGTTASHRRQVELIKIWTTLGSYMLAKGNIAAESIQRAKGVKGALSSAIDVTMLFLPEAILIALIKGQWPDEEDDDPVAWWLTKTVAEQGAATMPFVREIPSAIKGFGSGGPIGGAVGDVGKVYAQSAQGEVDLAAIKSYVSLFGTMTGLPSAQVNRIIDYAWRTSEGEETNPIEIIVGRQATR